MPEFDHDAFDIDFLSRCIDNGIDITSNPLTRLPEEQYPGAVARQFGKNYFAFLAQPGEEKEAAMRAAYRIRDLQQPWRTNAAVFLEDHIDKMMESKRA